MKTEPRYEFVAEEEEPRYEFVDFYASEEAPTPEPGVPEAPPVEEIPPSYLEEVQERGMDVAGVGEVLATMGTAFAGALPATAGGLYKAIEEKDASEFAKAFKHIQEFYTYEPRTEKGREFSETLAGVFEKYSAVVDEYLVEPNLENKNVLTAVIGKVSGEALPLLAPLLRVGKKGKAPRDPLEEFMEGYEPEGTVARGPEGGPIARGQVIREAPKEAAPLEGELIERPSDIIPVEERVGIEREAIEGELAVAPEEIAEQLQLEEPAYEIVEEAAVEEFTQEMREAHTASEQVNKDRYAQMMDELEWELSSEEVSANLEPYMKREEPSPETVSKFDPKQQGMIDPSVFFY